MRNTSNNTPSSVPSIHDPYMDTLTAQLALAGGAPHRGPEMRSCKVFFVFDMNKLLNKQSSCWLYESNLSTWSELYSHLAHHTKTLPACIRCPYFCWLKFPRKPGSQTEVWSRRHRMHNSYGQWPTTYHWLVTNADWRRKASDRCAFNQNRQKRRYTLCTVNGVIVFFMNPILSKSIDVDRSYWRGIAVLSFISSGGNINLRMV